MKESCIIRYAYGSEIKVEGSAAFICEFINKSKGPLVRVVKINNKSQLEPIYINKLTIKSII